MWTLSDTDIKDHVNQRVSLQSVNFPTRYVRHKNFAGWIDPVSSDADKKDSTFIVRRDLLGLFADRFGTISLESVNYPNYFLLVKDGLIVLEQRVVTKDDKAQVAFERSATFQLSCLLELSGEERISLSLFDYAHDLVDVNGSFVRHQDFLLKYQPNDGSDTFSKDATFRIVAPNWTA